MLPVAIAMWGSRARGPTLGFLGWFGPRGLASIVFAVIVVEESQLPHEHLIVLAIYLTVGLSVLAHGLTAAPLADRYARWFERHPREQAPPMESAPAEVTRPRRTRQALDVGRRHGALTRGQKRPRSATASPALARNPRAPHARACSSPSASSSTETSSTAGARSRQLSARATSCP